MVDDWRDLIHGWLHPGRCVLCGDPGTRRRDLCRHCAGALPSLARPCPGCALPLPAATAPGTLCGRCLRRPPPYDRLLAPLLYAAPADWLVQQLKFGGRLNCGRLLGEILAEHVAGAMPWRPQLLVPMPLHARRLRERGFNQADEIARPLARRLGIAVRNGAVRRVRDTASQAGLGLRERRRNLRGAFLAAPGSLGEDVAIVDDVVTTGASVHELARALRRGGARRIQVWAVCRTDRPPA